MKGKITDYHMSRQLQNRVIRFVILVELQVHLKELS